MKPDRSRRDDVMRRALWATTFFNLGGGLALAFPSSVLGQLAGLPGESSVLYRFTAALFVLLFGGAYAWLAMQSRIDRPMVAFTALGKASFFVLMVSLWLVDEASGSGLIAATGDLVFAAIFAWWLTGERQLA